MLSGMLWNFSKGYTRQYPNVKGLSRLMKYRFSQEVSQYSALNHTLMKSIYIFKQQDGYCGYLIRDDASKSLVCVDPGDYKVAIEHVKIMESQSQCKLTHILQTHKYHMTQDVHKFLTYNDSIKIIAGNLGEHLPFHNQLVKDLQPFSVGDLAICFLHSPGHSSDSFVIAITQVNQNSTKLPVIFTGETLQISTIGEVEDGQYKQMYDTLFKLKSFPTETLIFPARDAQLENIVFAKSLDPSNPIINLKLQLAKQALEKNTHILPTSLLEEKSCNPFLRTQDPIIQKIVGDKNPVEILRKLQLTQNLFFNTQRQNTR